MYLGFSRRESRGFLLVVPLLVLLYLIPIIYTRIIIDNDNDKHYTAYLEQVELVLAQKTIGSEGFNSNQTPKDTNVEQDTLTRFRAYKKPPEPKINAVDFSEADSILLQVVPGIGEVLAGRIIKYRESLGGLHKKQQILEVYGVTEEVANRLFEYFTFSPSIQKWIKINELDVVGLAEHPYINYGHAKVIVAYREQHGKYSNPEDLLKIKIFNEEWLDRLRPYLAFN
jgi:DNA uptake protein ComE-like DNA-binding protein